MTEPEKLDLRSHDIADDKRQELLRLFPEIRTEGGKLDFERLKLVLGEAVDVGKERFGLTWPGKAECMKAIQSPSSPICWLCSMRLCQSFCTRGELVTTDTALIAIDEGSPESPPLEPTVLQSAAQASGAMCHPLTPSRAPPRADGKVHG